MNMKQFEPTEKTLGGTQFFIRPFPAFTAARVSGELVKMLSPMMGGILRGMGTSQNCWIQIWIWKSSPPLWQGLFRPCQANSWNLS